MNRMLKSFSQAVVCLAMGVLLTACPDKPESFIEENVRFATEQTRRMLEVTGEPTGNNYPRNTNASGRFQTVKRDDWTCGFFAGSLWYLYELTGENAWKEVAKKWTASLEPSKYFTGNHDIGFIMYCSFGNAERLAPEPEYKEILLESANSQITRYNENVKLIKSWNGRVAWDGQRWDYPVIIDNMMNLELLCYATKVSGDTKYRDIAVNHANGTMKNHFREDFSSYHVVDYDSQTGEVLNKGTHQGYSDNSTWSRGQAWGIYGFTMMYRETKDTAYLNTALKLADYYLNHLPEDLVPYWDFNVDQEGYTPEGKSHAVVYREKNRDASAAAIACSALFELGELSGNTSYTKQAVKMLYSLASPAYRAQLGENANFILMHSVGSTPHKVEIDVPLVYADYYFLEAMVRYKRLMAKKS